MNIITFFIYDNLYLPIALYNFIKQQLTSLFCETNS